MITRAQKVFLFAQGCVLFVDLLFVSIRSLYGVSFFPVVGGASLVLLIALLWLLTDTTLTWRIVGLASTLAIGSIVLFLSMREQFADSGPVALLFLTGHALILWYVASTSASRSTIVVTHVAVAFVALLGLDLESRGLGSRLRTSVTHATPMFLFGSPLVAAGLWAAGGAFGRQRKAVIIPLACAIGQIGIGLGQLSDLGVRWAFPAAVMSWAVALAVAGILAKKFDPPRMTARRETPEQRGLPDN